MKHACHHFKKAISKLTEADERLIAAFIVWKFKTMREAAEHLGISYKTGQRRMEVIMQKLDVDTREQAIDAWKAQQEQAA